MVLVGNAAGHPPKAEFCLADSAAWNGQIWFDSVCDCVDCGPHRRCFSGGAQSTAAMAPHHKVRAMSPLDSSGSAPPYRVFAKTVDDSLPTNIALN